MDCRDSEIGQVRLRVGGEKANTEQSRLQCDAVNLLYNMNKTNESSLFFLIDIRLLPPLNSSKCMFICSPGLWCDHIRSVEASGLGDSRKHLLVLVEDRLLRLIHKHVHPLHDRRESNFRT